MKTEVNCPVCGGHCGWWYEYPETYWGQDPPEYIGKEDWIDPDSVPYCSEECLEEGLECTKLGGSTCLEIR